MYHDKHHNRAAEETQAPDRGSLDQHSYSKAQNRRVEVVFPDPDYSLLQRESISSDDSDPTSVEPDPGLVWELPGYQGISGYLDGGTAEVDLYAHDDQNNKWFLVFSAGSAYADRTEFRFANLVRGRKVFLRVHTRSGTLNMYCSPE